MLQTEVLQEYVKRFVVANFILYSPNVKNNVIKVEYMNPFALSEHGKNDYSLQHLQD
jgi:hypothetical protein